MRRVVLFLVLLSTGCAYRFEPDLEPLSPLAREQFLSLGLSVDEGSFASRSSRAELVARAAAQNVKLSFRFQSLTPPDCPWHFYSLLTLGILPGRCQEKTLVKVKLGERCMQGEFSYTTIGGLFGIPALVLSTLPGWRLGYNETDPLGREFTTVINMLIADRNSIQPNNCSDE